MHCATALIWREQRGICDRSDCKCRLKLHWCGHLNIVLDNIPMWCKVSFPANRRAKKPILFQNVRTAATWACLNLQGQDWAKQSKGRDGDRWLPRWYQRAKAPAVRWGPTYRTVTEDRWRWMNMERWWIWVVSPVHLYSCIAGNVLCLENSNFFFF